LILTRGMIVVIDWRIERPSMLVCHDWTSSLLVIKAIRYRDFQHMSFPSSLTSRCRPVDIGNAKGRPANHANLTSRGTMDAERR